MQPHHHSRSHMRRLLRRRQHQLISSHNRAQLHKCLNKLLRRHINLRRALASPKHLLLAATNRLRKASSLHNPPLNRHIHPRTPRKAELKVLLLSYIFAVAVQKRFGGHFAFAGGLEFLYK